MENRWFLLCKLYNDYRFEICLNFQFHHKISDTVVRSYFLLLPFTVLFTNSFIDGKLRFLFAVCCEMLSKGSTCISAVPLKIINEMHESAPETKGSTSNGPTQWFLSVFFRCLTVSFSYLKWHHSMTPAPHSHSQTKIPKRIRNAHAAVSISVLSHRNARFKHFFSNWWNLNWCRKRQRNSSTLNKRFNCLSSLAINCGEKTERALLCDLGLVLPLSQAQLTHIPCTAEHISALKIESTFPRPLCVVFISASVLLPALCVCIATPPVLFDESNSLATKLCFGICVCVCEPFPTVQFQCVLSVLLS